MTYDDDRFEAIWSRVWRKSGKRAAYKAWLKLDDDEISEVESVFEAHRKEFTGTELRFRPHLSTWLNQGRWEDELGDPLTADQPPGYDPAMDPGGWILARWRRERQQTTEGVQ